MNCIYCGTVMPDGRCVNQCAEREQKRAMERPVYKHPEESVTMTALLAKFPDFNPRWEEDVQKQWFETFNKFLEVSNKPTNVMEQFVSLH